MNRILLLVWSAYLKESLLLTYLLFLIGVVLIADKRANYPVKIKGIEIHPDPIQGGQPALFKISATSGKIIRSVFFLILSSLPLLHLIASFPSDFCDIRVKTCYSCYTSNGTVEKRFVVTCLSPWFLIYGRHWPELYSEFAFCKCGTWHGRFSWAFCRSATGVINL